MSGALAERVFADKLEAVGFTDLVVVDRRPFGLRDAARYPLFTPDLIELMHRLLPEERRDQVAIAITATVVKPPSEADHPDDTADTAGTDPAQAP